MIVCSGTFGGIPFTDKAHAAAKAGFSGISIYLRESESGTRSMLDDLGLDVAEVDGPMAWLPGQPGPEPRVVLEAAAQLGARAVTVLEITGSLVDGAVEHFAALCDLAEPYGLMMQIEPFPWSGIDSLGAAAGIVIETGRSNGGVLLDTWHLRRGPDRGRLSDVATIVAVQVSDTLPQAMGDVPTESMHHRLLPAAQSAQIVAELRAAGNSAPLEVEVYSDALHALPAIEIARQAADALHVAFGAWHQM